MFHVISPSSERVEQDERRAASGWSIGTTSDPAGTTCRSLPTLRSRSELVRAPVLLRRLLDDAILNRLVPIVVSGW